MVHEKKKWRIGIKYDDGIDFTEEQRKELETAIEEAFNVWLEPVRNYSKGYVVDDFEFIEIKPRPFRRYHKRKPRNIDLEITFKQGFGRSHWKPEVIGGLGMIRMFKGENFLDSASGDNNIVGYSWNTLLHEIGHAFGLWDTYPAGKRKSAGGSDETSGKHAESIMSGPLSNSKRLPLTYDDITGIHDIYRIHVLEYRDEKECSSGEFKWDKDSSGCVPKYPVIFEAKYGNKSTLERVLKDDPNVSVNETNPLGDTALHEAILRGWEDVVRVLLDKELRGSDIDVNIPNNNGQTPLHFLAATMYSDESESILDDLMSAQAKLSARDNKGKTPYDYAKEYNDIAEFFGGEGKFPYEFLERLNPANAGIQTQE